MRPLLAPKDRQPNVTANSSPGKGGSAPPPPWIVTCRNRPDSGHRIIDLRALSTTVRTSDEPVGFGRILDTPELSKTDLNRNRDLTTIRGFIRKASIGRKDVCRKKAIMVAYRLSTREDLLSMKAGWHMFCSNLSIGKRRLPAMAAMERHANDVQNAQGDLDSPPDCVQ